MKATIIKLIPTDPLFPEQFKHLPQPPKQIFVQGDLAALLKRPAVAIVGSRRASAYGQAVTRQLASELASMGIVIISGLAFGIDSVGHEVVIKAGGQTIAVLPSPLEKIYPASHYQLAQTILKTGGALLSEYPEGADVRKENFIARNRLIAALGQGVIIPEGALKSGSLHTARFALEQGKVVMAVPGNINSYLSEGTNNLIKAGAIPITCVEDIASALGLNVKHLRQTQIVADNREEQLILDLLTDGPRHASQLLAESSLGPEIFNQTLTMLEIGGHIRPLGGGHWSLV